MTDVPVQGSLTAAEQAVAVPTLNRGTVSVQITGTFSATLSFEVTVDGTNWVAVDAVPVAGGSTVSSATAAGVWQVDVSGLPAFRVRCSAYTSGTAVVTVCASTAPGASSTTISGAVTVDTEMPAAAALADNTANPTVPSLGSFLMAWDGTTWDRVPGTSADGLLVNTEIPAAAALADAAANPTTPTLGAAEIRFNGATWDRQRSNAQVTCYASAARTADPTAMADQTNYNYKGIHVVIDVTAIADSPSVVFTIQGKDALSGKYYTILQSAAIVGTGTVILKVCPGITAAANLSVADLLPHTWRVIAVHGDSDSITYSVGASLVQ